MARPEFKPTASMRRQVAIAAGAGMAHADIAEALGIARNTLTKHFNAELSRGAHEKRLAVLSAMHKAAVGGNVSAQKAYMGLSLTACAGATTSDQKAPPRGKKAQAEEAAMTAAVGTAWEGLLNVTPIRKSAG